MKEALYYGSASPGKVVCQLCPHQCRLATGQTGLCGVRRHEDGVLYSTSYSQVAALALDPMEKKPLYHFHPGREVLSLGMPGCNLGCSFCQNWYLARGKLPTRRLEPAAAVQMARDLAPRCAGLSYTYSEPLVSYEYVLDTARLAREQGLVNTLVTNGYINPRPWRELLPWIDAVNVDVKAWQDQFYRRWCGGTLSPVRETVEAAYGAGCHVEVTTLLVTGENDSMQELAGLVDWLAGIDPALPLHFSRYFPHQGFHAPITPRETLEEARALARRRLHYVFLGNVEGSQGRNTSCPGCGQILVRRDRGRVEFPGVDDGRCLSCQRPLDIRGLETPGA